MHRFILGITDPKIQVDHINGDSLDNRKINLRLCSNSENSRNRGANKNNTSGYKGVRFRKEYGTYFATITVNRKEIYLGSFKTGKEAATAYNEAAIKYHDKFANLNEV